MKAALCAAILALYSSSALPSEGIWVEGSIECADWIKARRSQGSEYYEHYVVGFLNGIALGRGREFWRAEGNKATREATFLWMDNYCQSNPFGAVVTGLFKLVEERAGPLSSKGVRQK